MSHNVFADLDLPKPDELFLRAALLRAVRGVMRKSGLTQEELAQKTGLKQPDVSRILNGGERGFSTDRLARIAFRLGYLPTVDLRPLPREEKARSKAKASSRAA
ncbi:MAG TPA: helix-turn-helix transcriptional regulator [Dongiaceae bacterium]|jgi:predicted XRE-type DNA-binding protein